MNANLLGPPRPQRSTGFTLIELMITVAIVAILAAIAMPSYRAYAIRGQLTDATTGLSAMRANMERYFQDNRSYMGVNSPCSAPPPILAGNFTLTCPVLTATTFTLQAQGTASPLSGFSFFVDQNDSQSTVVTSPPAPGAFLGCTTAWITKTGGC